MVCFTKIVKCRESWKLRPSSAGAATNAPVGNRLQSVFLAVRGKLDDRSGLGTCEPWDAGQIATKAAANHAEEIATLKGPFRPFLQLKYFVLYQHELCDYWIYFLWLLSKFTIFRCNSTGGFPCTKTIRWSSLSQRLARATIVFCNLAQLWLPGCCEISSRTVSRESGAFVKRHHVSSDTPRHTFLTPMAEDRSAGAAANMLKMSILRWGDKTEPGSALLFLGPVGNKTFKEDHGKPLP